MYVALTRDACLLLLFQDVQVLTSDGSDFALDDTLKNGVRCLDSVFLEEVDCVYAVLNDPEQHHADHFLDRLPIEVINEDILNVAARHLTHLLAQHLFVDLLQRIYRWLRRPDLLCQRLGQDSYALRSR